MIENTNENRSKKTNIKTSRILVEATNEWQIERFKITHEKRIRQQKNKGCACLKSNKRFCDLACARCKQRNKASFDRSNEFALHIRDLVGKLLKRLLNSFVAQLLIELIKALME